MQRQTLKILTLSIFLLTLSIFHTAESYIQIETGQLFHEMIDLELTDGRFPLTISRQYQQTKAGKSILGDRWCFDFEQQMKAENGGYRLYACGNPTTVFFALAGNSLIYGKEKMFEMKSGGLLRRASKRLTLIYNDKGFLISKARSGGKKHSIKYLYDDEDRPDRISYEGRILLDFRLDQNGNTTGIFIKNKKVVNYVVTNEKLVLGKNGWGFEHQFEYDELGLLAQIKYPDNTTEKFGYSKKTKTVNELVAKDGCIRSFDYKFDIAKTKTNFVMKDSCVKEQPLKITLRRADVPKKKSKLTVKRDRYNRIQSIENKQYSWSIGYDIKNGQVSTLTENTKSTKRSKTYQVVYRHNKIIEISESGRAKVNYIYSNNGRLLRIRSTAAPAEKLILMAKADQIRSILEDSAL